MNRIARLTLACAVLTLGAAFADDHAVTMTGEYVWERSDQEIPGEIEAVFTPADADGMWNVVFTFEWEGEMREWHGEAKGSLTDGTLSGHALEDRDRKRTFMFEGDVSDGSFTGKHGRERDGEFRSSGRMTLSAS